MYGYLQYNGWHLLPTYCSYGHVYLRDHLVQDIVKLEREPGQSKESHHNHQHLDDFLLVVHHIDVSLQLSSAGGLDAPQSHRHPI